MNTKISKQAGKHFAELGVTGLKRSAGTISEEFLPNLTGERGLRALREMRDNDPVIGAVLYAIEMLLRNVTWRVEGDDDEQAEFLESCLDDMSATWEDTVAEILSMLVYGYSFHEIVYKRRMGKSKDPARNSQYSDGKIGWRKFPIRSQDSLLEWRFDEEGGVQAFVQVAPPKFERTEIPIEHGLLFRPRIQKGSPEGVSILRNCYRPWYMKRRIEDLEAIGIERDLAGMPMFRASAEVLDAYRPAFQRILTSLRRDEQDGLILPMVKDEAGNDLLTFELLGSPGSRQINLTQVIDRYDKRIAMTCLADFIMLGQSSVGSFALSSNKTALFASALGAILKSVAAVMNRHAIPRLFALNGIKAERMPYLVPGDIETPDLQEIGSYVTALAGAGAPLFPDDELEAHLRQIANLPEKAPEAMPTLSPSQRAAQHGVEGVPPAPVPGQAVDEGEPVAEQASKRQWWQRLRRR